MDRYQESFATDSAPFVEARNEYPITQESVKFNTAASGSCCYTSAGSFTFTVPAGVYNIAVEVIGGGAGALGRAEIGATYRNLPWMQGTAGHTVFRDKIPVNPGETKSVVVGSGGCGCDVAGGSSFYVCCGSQSCFYDSNFSMTAAGGYGPTLYWSGACVCLSCMSIEYMKLVNSLGNGTDSGGLIIADSPSPILFMTHICCSSPPVFDLVGNKSSRGNRGTHLLFLSCYTSPTRGSSGVSSCLTNSQFVLGGATGAVIISWYKGQ
jgi:hypothetical protein